jgi:dehydrogenase/reductase SDR family protein 7B
MDNRSIVGHWRGAGKEWLARGGRCVLSGRNVAALEAVASDAPDRCLVLPFETTDYAAIPALVEKAVAFSGDVDVLVNNAGISQRSLAIDTDMSVYRKIVDVDLLAPIALTQALLPHLLARGSGGIVMISSVAGKAGVPMRTAYCAAKHGLVGYADSLRSEIAGQGIKGARCGPGFSAHQCFAQCPGV